MFHRGTKRPRFSVGGHSVFTHDDSSNHSGLGVGDYEDDSLSQQHNISTNSSDPNFSFGHFAPDRPRRAPKSTTKAYNDDNTNLNACLDHLLRILSRKDKQGFFQYPVTDQFAPGYSQIILHPMDFSTMKKKINQDDYSNVLEFRSDFELMCENAMKYNRPDTVYWQAAKKLLATGSKLMNKEKLISYRRSLECFSHLTERELGFRIDSTNHPIDDSITSSNEQIDTSINDFENFSSPNTSQSSVQRKPKLILKLPKYYEKVPAVIPDEEVEEDEFSPEEILSQAQQAALCAHEKLSSRGPIPSYTLEYQRANGSTSLHFINQNDFSEQIITLGELNNENISSSTAKYFLENGPFSSNPSQSDSAFSSTSKEELDLLIHTYGSEYSAQYAVSLMDYVKNAGDLALAYVDRFLSVLTNGEHDNYILKTREKQVKDEEIEHKNIETNSSTDQVKLEPQINSDNENYMQLRDTQYDHLSHQELPSQPTNEYDLAEKALFNFNDMSQISNGPEPLISSDIINNNNDSSFDTL